MYRKGVSIWMLGVCLNIHGNNIKDKYWKNRNKDYKLEALEKKQNKKELEQTLGKIMKRERQ